MKISIGTNIFGNNIKQLLGIETLLRQKSFFSQNINLYAFQLHDQKEEVPIEFTKVLLERDSRDLVYSGTKAAPCIKDILDKLAETDCDYIVYTNSDILFSKKFFNYILDSDKQYTGYACSRMDIFPITSLNQPLKPYRYEVAGQDTFVIKKDWYIENRHLIKDYIIGSIWYDTALTTILKVYGQNDPIINDYPVQIAHIHHGWGSGLPSPENDYNTKLYESENETVRESWAWYYHNILIKRPDGFNMFTLYPNEKQIEKEHFDKYLI
jgi:hypothetical protein